MDAIDAFRPQRAVSARTLSRETARILDEICETGHPVAVVRYGRIEAVLVPLEDGPKVGLARSFRATEPMREERIELDDLDLTTFEREMFERVATSESGLWSLNGWVEGKTISEILVACANLEMCGLIERFGASVQLTKAGKKARGGEDGPQERPW